MLESRAMCASFWRVRWTSTSAQPPRGGVGEHFGDQLQLTNLPMRRRRRRDRRNREGAQHLTAGHERLDDRRLPDRALHTRVDPRRPRPARSRSIRTRRCRRRARAGTPTGTGRRMNVQRVRWRLAASTGSTRGSCRRSPPPAGDRHSRLAGTRRPGAVRRRTPARAAGAGTRQRVPTATPRIGDGGGDRPRFVAARRGGPRRT